MKVAQPHSFNLCRPLSVEENTFFAVFPVGLFGQNMPPFNPIKCRKKENSSSGKNVRNCKICEEIVHLCKLGPGRPSAGKALWDRRSNAVTHASPRACGAWLGLEL